jgi:phage baseplate assembly protein W
MTQDYTHGDYGAYVYSTYQSDKVSVPVSFFLLWNVGDQPSTPAPSSPASEDTQDHISTSTGQTITSTVSTKVSAAVSAAVASHRSLVNFAAGLTAEETANGDYVEVTIKSSACGEAAKEVIQNAANAISAQIAMILDIQVDKMAKNGAPISNVSLLQQAISISLSSPEGVDPALYDFAIIRLHEGKTDILPDMDSDPNTITIATDRFSPYTIVYGAKGSFDAYKTTAVTASQSSGRSPKTGEANSYALPLALIAIICIGCGVIVLSRKVRKS